MKKNVLIIALCLILLLSVGLAACKDTEPYTYEPSDDYFNLYLTLTANGATARAFSFFTPEDESYWDACSVQLDPAEQSETEPQFNTKDNILIDAKSKDPFATLEASSLGENEIVMSIITSILPGGMRHKAEATGLNAGQKYFYRVGSESKDTWSAWGSFTTDDGDGSFSFLHITDSQADSQEAFDAFKLTLDAALEHAGIPEFILSSGDQIESIYFPEEWKMFYESTKEAFSKTSFVPVNGNHEMISYLSAYSFNVPINDDNYVYYSFDYGNALIVVLDTQDIIRSDSKFEDKAQFNWLKETLENSDQKWKIVTFHKSLYSTGSHAADPDVLKFKEALTPVFSEYGVDLVLSGHDHVYARTVPINAAGDAGGQREYSEETLVNGVVKHTYTDAMGTIHVINRSVGSKFYGNSKKLNDHLLAAWDKNGKVETPVFSKVDIIDDTLTYTSYEHDRDTGEITVIDCFALYKPNK